MIFTTCWRPTVSEQIFVSPFPQAFQDALDEKMHKELEVHDAQYGKRKWITHDACANCGRPFKGDPKQTWCRRRDCRSWLDVGNDARERARDKEIALLQYLQEEEEAAGQRAFVRPYDPTLVDAVRLNSKSAPVKLDAPIPTPDGEIHSLHEVAVAACPRHLVEWLDPTFDRAEPHLQVWQDGLRLRRRLGQLAFDDVRGRADELVVGWSQGRRFARRDVPIRGQKRRRGRGVWGVR